MARTALEIANHIVYYCIGDNCSCCDWSDEDRAALESMSVGEADRLTSGDTSNAHPLCDDADCYCCEDDGYEPPTPHDLSDDAEALASAGWGTDEQYGYYGDD